MGRWPAWLALVLLIVAVFLPLPARRVGAQQPETLVVIMASSSQISDLPSGVLRSAFLGLSTVYRGTQLIPFNAPIGTPIRARMDWALLGLEQREVGTFWVDQRVRDGRMPPRTVSSTDLAVRVVAQLPGAIACVPASQAGPRVRALRIDGVDPSSHEYLLAR